MNDARDYKREDALYYEQQMNSLASLVGAIAKLDLDYLENCVSYAEALGPIVDPTAYRDGGGTNLQDQKKLVAAAQQLKKVVTDMQKRRSRS